MQAAATWAGANGLGCVTHDYVAARTDGDAAHSQNASYVLCVLGVFFHLCRDERACGSARAPLLHYMLALPAQDARAVLLRACAHYTVRRNVLAFSRA